MSFGNIFVNPCLNAAPEPDVRCEDDAFRIANPDVCPQSSTLTIKPGTLIVCALGSVQFSATITEAGIEKDVTADAIWTSSDQTKLVVGASSGKATGLAAGSATVSVTYDGMTAHADVTVLGCTGNGDDCSDLTVAIMAVVDQTKSMSLDFNSGYDSKLDYAKEAAYRLINEVNEAKDLIGLTSFTDFGYVTHSEPIADKDSVALLVDDIVQTQQKTSFYEALSAAIDSLNGVTSDFRMLVLFSDGEDSDTSYTSDDNPITLLANFKATGGIVMCVGVRASGKGYNLLSEFSTGGFFINGHDETADATLDYMSGLKGYICAGNCTETGDDYVAKGQLDYADFENWRVEDGHVDLIGDTLNDLIPDNGLYLDMSGSKAVYSGKIVTKDGIAVTAGDVYSLTVALAGNQRVNASSNRVRLRVFERNTDGVADPTIAPVLTVNESGAAATAETYRYAYSYVNANGETDLSPSDTATINTEGATIDIAATADATATLVRIWRTTGASPESRYYLIAEIDPSTPTMTDSDHKASMLAKIAAETIDSSILIPESNTTGTPIDLISQVVTINNFAQGFIDYSFSATAVNTGTVFISVQQVATPVGYDDIGLLLDNVRFRNETSGVMLLEDDFDTENLTYVSPACGEGTEYVLLESGSYGYDYGYNCYGEGCLDLPPAVQSQDPDPLSDIEQGYVPPQLFTANNIEACAECEEGYEDISTTENLVPTMTSATTPSGVVSASDYEVGYEPYRAFDAVSSTVDDDTGAWKVSSWAQAWIQYQFTSAKTIESVQFSIRNMDSGNVQLRVWGSNDGSDWTAVSNPEIIAASDWFYDLNASTRHSLFAGTSYAYYRIIFSTILGTYANLTVDDIQLIGTSPGVPPGTKKICSTASATSPQSYEAARSAAYAAALADAQSKLDCIGVYTSTKSYTAKCPSGLGQDVTRSATATSYISQQDADAIALAAATADAEGDLVCTSSNNTQRLDINDRIGASAAKATPYPGVKYVSGLGETIVKVTVTLKGYNHGKYPDVHALLVSPEGTAVYLMGNCMDGAFDTTERNITLDDAAALSIPELSRPVGVTHTFKPTYYGTQIEHPSPAPTKGAGYPATLAEFIGENPNGSWLLYVIDDTTLDYGYMVLGWDLTITAV